MSCVVEPHPFRRAQIRLEPYTTQFLRFQDGHFDHADRMFHSIEAAWRYKTTIDYNWFFHVNDSIVCFFACSSVTTSTSDVKELTPEFFYLPEFLRNENDFDLGVTQTGVQLGDVILPPW